ncbi:cell division protein FtsK [Weissella confusa]|uniref:cell division protein FtsK n=1 Tax=Weissella confusa TaxID=1583 RepID=UPI001C6F89D3|nr:cell division protein FtsK [Weissella confusa]QYU58826.1 cell division protein FtsK [Weissella confusa]
MFKKIRYSDQYLAKTLWKRALLFILFLTTVALSGCYVKIFQSISAGVYSWWLVVPVLVSLMLVAGAGWGLVWFYRQYAPTHSDFFSKWLRQVELRQLISLLIVSKGYFDLENDDKGSYLHYWPKVRLKVLFKTGQLLIEEPVDGAKYMQRFSNGEFDIAVETALLADRQTREFSKNKLVSTFAFDPIKFRRQMLDLVPQKGLLQISKGIDWEYDKFYNALITGNVGTGKSYTMFSIIGQLLVLTKYVYVVDPKNSDLATLQYVEELKGNVASDLVDITNLVGVYYQNMMKRSKILENNKSKGRIGSYFDFNMTPAFLVFDEFGAFVEMGNSLDFRSDERQYFDQAMSQLSQIAMLGRELGFYLIIGMQRPSADSLPMSIRNQLNLRLNMGLPTPEVKRMMFPDSDKELRPLAKDLKGWGFIQVGDTEVRAFFAPEVPKQFNLHDYMRQQISKRK